MIETKRIAERRLNFYVRQIKKDARVETFKELKKKQEVDYSKKKLVFNQCTLWVVRNRVKMI